MDGSTQKDLVPVHPKDEVAQLEESVAYDEYGRVRLGVMIHDEPDRHRKQVRSNRK